MGHYHSLRMRGFLHAEGDHLWWALMQHQDWLTAAHQAHDPAARDAILEYALLDRSRFIPFGGLQGEPRGWSDGFDEPQALLSRHRSTHVSFCCSVKDSNVVECFVLNVVPRLFRKVETCESYFDYDNTYRRWQLENGQMKEIS